ncbi:RIP metalloprotease RseP [Clostridium fallax]|uniref:Zinc metalloprotease n=1 Tax=Clostridium fallax TaxID=1533 RepID=A0A1M4V2T1_9CLOT|nr:RIP metalloprotease RseP [Clostridium fallax]SHE63212.1 site-2 protease. Metallo peptidase. MEROPS family M50B [Clostridium fallax]SQB06579.1 membrane-associated zinc metalloprotease [Clostridium fallax]
MYIVWAILAFSLLIIVHEFGHFILAKINGVKVLEFSIGMGPKVFGIKRKETEYCLKALPIGGYVKMYGEEEDVNDSGSFSSKSPLQRISIIAAGAIMNILLALLCFGIYTSQTGIALTTIKEVLPDSPAQAAGLKPGDEILKAGKTKILTKNDLIVALAESKGDPIDIKYKGAEGIKESIVTPKLDNDGRYLIGITNDFIEKPTFIQCVKNSFLEGVSMVKQTYGALKTIITGKANLKKDVGGPVTIVKMSGQIAKAGFLPLVWFTAFLSTQLAVFNLLPFPALDGGWIVILLIEMISGRKVPEKAVQFVNTLGFMALMALMVLVTVKDILFPIKF